MALAAGSTLETTRRHSCCQRVVHVHFRSPPVLRPQARQMNVLRMDGAQLQPSPSPCAPHTTPHQFPFPAQRTTPPRRRSGTSANHAQSRRQAARSAQRPAEPPAQVEMLLRFASRMLEGALRRRRCRRPALPPQAIRMCAVAHALFFARLLEGSPLTFISPRGNTGSPGQEELRPPADRRLSCPCRFAGLQPERRSCRLDLS